MGLLTNILLSPFLGPIWGTRWTLEKVDRVGKEELTDDTPIKEDLMQLQLQLEMGEIDDEEVVGSGSTDDVVSTVRPPSNPAHALSPAVSRALGRAHRGRPDSLSGTSSEGCASMPVRSY